LSKRCCAAPKRAEASGLSGSEGEAPFWSNCSNHCGFPSDTFANAAIAE